MGGSNTYLGNNLYLLTSHAAEEYQGKGIKNYYKDFKSGMFADGGKFAIRFNDTGSNPLNITKYSSFIVIITLQEYDEFVKVNGERGILNLSL